MTWLTWRQFRVSVSAVFVALVAFGVVLAITGPDLVGRTDFSDMEVLYGVATLVMYVLPAVVGAFWAVPMVTRELETGTHSLVWNQTVTRARWLATKLAVGLLASMAATGLLSLAVTWWASPVDTMAVEDPSGFPARIMPLAFGARGIVPVGYAALAFVLGLAVGIVLRRTVTAMAVTVVLFAAVQLAVPLLVRPHLMPQTEETVTVTEENVTEIVGRPGVGVEYLNVAEPDGAWVLTNETVDSNGEVVDPLPASIQNCLRPPDFAPDGRDMVVTCLLTGLTDLGYRQHLSYQPGHNFWPLQWIETGVFLAVSALIAWFAFRRIRYLS